MLRWEFPWVSTECPSDWQVVSTMLVGPRVPPALCKLWECPVSPPQPHGAHFWAYEAVVVSGISRDPIQLLKLFLCITALSKPWPCQFHSPQPCELRALSPQLWAECALLRFPSLWWGSDRLQAEWGSWRVTLRGGSSGLFTIHRL